MDQLPNMCMFPLVLLITNLDPDVVAQMSLQRGINFRSLAEKMGNCSGAEVRGICTEPGLFCHIGRHPADDVVDADECR